MNLAPTQTFEFLVLEPRPNIEEVLVIHSCPIWTRFTIVSNSGGLSFDQSFGNPHSAIGWSDSTVLGWLTFEADS